MKVRELIDELKSMDPDAEVHIAYPSGDHWRTTVAPVLSSADEMQVKHSAYHSKDVLVADEDWDDNADCVVVLQA